MWVMSKCRHRGGGVHLMSSSGEGGKFPFNLRLGELTPVRRQ